MRAFYDPADYKRVRHYKVQGFKHVTHDITTVDEVVQPMMKPQAPAVQWSGKVCFNPTLSGESACFSPCLNNSSPFFDDYGDEFTQEFPMPPAEEQIRNDDCVSLTSSTEIILEKRLEEMTRRCIALENENRMLQNNMNLLMTLYSVDG
eukprot:CAMPEP_0168523808 /NCGR_PEP_ID=MMETSP0405-20121227/10225_1 /TAXON_ID=498012 /ORGANISM="Trichosphaerium sp, Strain Am-I-7 wt" /LENGTH=148 /DNA_ID=CAMNT_0008545795 /DNA_START=261 /DNA_END=707 /DNA_ORIENTATION=-